MQLGCFATRGIRAGLLFGAVSFEVMAKLKADEVETSRQGRQTRSQGLEPMESVPEETQWGDSLHLEQMGQEVTPMQEENLETSAKEGNTATSPGRPHRDRKRKTRDLMF